jgi:zinc D-Ala-D-Ala carboxypeptidase
MTTYNEKKWRERYPNFHAAEVHGKHGKKAILLHGRILIDLLFMDMVQALRDEIGRMRVTSGHRSQLENIKIGGAEFSRHIEGKALDFIPLDVDPQKAIEAAEEIGFSYIKYYDTTGHIHIHIEEEL